MSNNFFFSKIVSFCDNVGKYGWAGEVTDGSIIQRMRFACRKLKLHTHARTHSEYALVRFHVNIGIFQWLNPSGRIVAMGSTQPLNRNEYQESFLGVNTAGA
jgi:hypothetical protein